MWMRVNESECKYKGGIYEWEYKDKYKYVNMWGNVNVNIKEYERDEWVYEEWVYVNENMRINIRIREGMRVNMSM